MIYKKNIKKHNIDDKFKIKENNKNMIKNFLLTFLIAGTIIGTKAKSNKLKQNKIINGHDLDQLEEDDIYIGQDEEEIINILGAPFKVPGQDSTLYYFKSIRKIYTIFPLKGQIESGQILTIELDDEKKVKSFEKKEYTQYKTSKKIAEKLNELKLEIKKREEQKKEFFKKLAKKHRERIKEANLKKDKNSSKK